MNIIAQLEFELAYFVSRVHRLNNYTTSPRNNYITEPWIVYIKYQIIIIIIIIIIIVDFAVPADHRMKLKECEKKDKYLDLARQLKNYGTGK